MTLKFFFFTVRMCSYTACVVKNVLKQLKKVIVGEQHLWFRMRGSLSLICSALSGDLYIKVACFLVGPSFWNALAPHPHFHDSFSAFRSQAKHQQLWGLRLRALTGAPSSRLLQARAFPPLRFFSACMITTCLLVSLDGRIVKPVRWGVGLASFSA